MASTPTTPTTPGSDPSPDAPPTLAANDVFVQEIGEVVWGVVDESIPLDEGRIVNYEPWVILKHFAPVEAGEAIILSGIVGVDSMIEEIASLLLKVRGGRR